MRGEKEFVTIDGVQYPKGAVERAKEVLASLEDVGVNLSLARAVQLAMEYDNLRNTAEPGSIEDTLEFWRRMSQSGS